MRTGSSILCALFLLFVSSLSQGAVSVIQNESPGIRSILEIILNNPGSTMEFSILSSSDDPGTGTLLASTGTHKVDFPENFELSVTSSVTLSPGDYWFFASITMPSTSPGISGIAGYIQLPLRITDQSEQILSLGVDREEGFVVYSLANPVPESSTALLGGIGVLSLLRRNRPYRARF